MSLEALQVEVHATGRRALAAWSYGPVRKALTTC